MLDNIQGLAESKLLILYIFNKYCTPVSNIQITDVVLENNLLNYFHLQQYLAELSSSGFLNLTREGKKQLYAITSMGKNALEYFENRIDDTKKKIIDTYFISRGKEDNEQYKATADYYPGDENYVVSCKLIEGGRSLIELTINTPSVDKAKLICSSWKSGAVKKYNSILNLLTT